jgi:hypothetical protein
MNPFQRIYMHGVERSTPLGYRLRPHVVMPRAVECGALLTAVILAEQGRFKLNVARDDGSLKLTNTQLSELISVKCGEEPASSFTGNVINVMQYLLMRLGYRLVKRNRNIFIHPMPIVQVARHD